MGGRYNGGGAPEILSRLKVKGQANKDSIAPSEESARNVLGAPEFSSRALVSSPSGRFKD